MAWLATSPTTSAACTDGPPSVHQDIHSFCERPHPQALTSSSATAHSGSKRCQFPSRKRVTSDEGELTFYSFMHFSPGEGKIQNTGWKEKKVEGASQVCEPPIPHPHPLLS
eukprot:TRINITY_DN26001_c1_g1_i1.p4 TRINITY_DN26001_c1_g1~~TRINITY_DN26001_c1_g1_i1.p4  ORF type:complete len:111 (+),score=2.86 TRINITY_DN26001_c1_g1_i1:290-622(+)